MMTEHVFRSNQKVSHTRMYVRTLNEHIQRSNVKLTYATSKLQRRLSGSLECKFKLYIHENWGLLFIKIIQFKCQKCLKVSFQSKK